MKNKNKKTKKNTHIPRPIYRRATVRNFETRARRALAASRIDPNRGRADGENGTRIILRTALAECKTDNGGDRPAVTRLRNT